MYSVLLEKKNNQLCRDDDKTEILLTGIIINSTLPQRKITDR